MALSFPKLGSVLPLLFALPLVFAGTACGMDAKAGAESRLHGPALRGTGTAWNGKKFRFRVYRLKGFRGLSGLTVDTSGVLWAASERDGQIVRLERTAAGIRARAFPTRIFMPGRDVEAIALAGKGFLLGTERRYFSAAADELIRVRLQDGRFRASRRFPLSYKIWNSRAQKNRGIEGLCLWNKGPRQFALAVSETVALRQGRRRALMALGTRKQTAADFDWTPLYFPLTSRVGKIAGLHCSPRGAGVRVLAIERHYGVRRLLAFRIPRAAAPAVSRVRILLDLKETLRDPTLKPRERSRFNPEGIARLPDGTIAVIGDNSAADTATLLVLLNLQDG